MQGKKVLLVDADPQGDLTTCLGWRDTDGLPITLANKMTEVMREETANPFDGILHHNEGVDLVPANLELSALEMSLVTTMSRETTMRAYLEQVKDRYDYILLPEGRKKSMQKSSENSVFQFFEIGQCVPGQERGKGKGGDVAVHPAMGQKTKNKNLSMKIRIAGCQRPEAGFYQTDLRGAALRPPARCCPRSFPSPPAGVWERRWSTPEVSVILRRMPVEEKKNG